MIAHLIEEAEDLDFERRYRVRPLPFLAARDFVTAHHYSKGTPNAQTAAYGLWEGSWLIGAIMFATPCSEAVRGSVFGPDHVQRVTELSRLVILDVTPRNAESWLIARALHALKLERPHLWAVVSFADPSAGHVGTIYQATNALYYGQGRRERFFVDPGGRLRHRRQCGRNISPERAAELGWTPVTRLPKHRYAFFMGDSKRHRRELLERTVLERQPYPKPGSTMNGNAR